MTTPWFHGFRVFVGSLFAPGVCAPADVLALGCEGLAIG
jgi:hypothetical protein